MTEWHPPTEPPYPSSRVRPKTGRNCSRWSLFFSTGWAAPPTWRNPYRPHMVVIIGRRGTVNPLLARDLEDELPRQLHLRTYDDVLVKLKYVERLANEHTAQCLNYLRASGRNLCLLVNFQTPKVEWKRIVYG